MTVTYSEQDIKNILYSVDDPEMGMNIVELGLVYSASHSDGKIKVSFTLTSPMCPLEEYMHSEIKQAIEQNTGLTCETTVVWDPLWSPGMMTEGARIALGI